MTSRKSAFVTAIALLTAGVISNSALAASVNYGDFFGSDVTFRTVIEDSSTDNVPLFGAPIATANSLAFSPTAFGSSANGGNSDITDSQLRMTIESNGTDTGITFIVVNEVGDFTLQGPSGADASANVGAAMFWTIIDVDGQPLPGPLPQGQANITFTSGSGPNGGEFSLPGDAGTAVPWEGQYIVDVDAFLLQEGLSGVATKIEFTLDNSLSTFADESSAAFIKKKEAQQVTIQAVAQNLPEPGASALMLPALLVGLSLRRKLK